LIANTTNPADPQGRGEQSLVALDGDFDRGRLGGIFSRVLGQLLGQLAEAGNVVTDTPRRHHHAIW
jgi:hypothetical protein